MSTLEHIRARLHDHPKNILELTDAEVDALGSRDIELLQAEYGSTVLMRIPPREHAFMLWLRDADPGVYDDLWSDDADLLVSLSFLKDFQKGGPGFQICELEEHANYFFVPRHIKQEGADALKDILAKAERGDDLSVEEVFMFEIVRAPIDIWHFCYRYEVPVLRGKEAVRQLVAHDWLVHLPQREDLVSYIEDL